MLLFKLLQQFLLPGTFWWLLIFAGLILFLKFKKQKVGKILIVSGLVVSYFFSLAPIADLILLPLENQYRPLTKDQLEQADKIVLLTGEMTARSSEVLRIYIENLKLERSNFEIIISGTSALEVENSDEAQKTKEFLVAQGVPSESIILEVKSRNTFESAENITNLLGTEPFFLVTSAYHLPRSMEIFQKIGSQPIPAPTDFLKSNNYTILSFLPTSGSLQKSDLVVHEYFGLLFYRVKLFLYKF